ncbi:ankyrin repeat domain-containing protein [Erythrobacter sp. W53]|uniref:ankyrin repeat domain-containing protein n=1 Tax=Erythrobacter sp. W53 TaxID=3425947 RepID=UPI003D768B59
MSSILCALVVGLFVAGPFAEPVAAQNYSAGFEFLKAVKDRDGDAVTKTLNEPGSTVVNTRDITTGESALHIVTARRDVQWIRFLTSRGANPNIEDNKGVTPLQIASGLGLVEGVEALIAAGANINKANVTGETALLSAVHRRDLAMVRLLLENGADVDRADNSGRTARDYVELMSANTQLLDAIKRSDEKREQGANQSYGPSF